MGLSLSGYVPALEGLPRYDTDGAGGAHLYMPWWLFDQKNKDFPRGYHIEINGGYRQPQIGFGGDTIQRHGGYGRDLKAAIRREYGCFVRFAGRGEMIPNNLSYCEIDPEVVDQFGIPVLRFHFRWSDHEWKQARHMESTFRDIIETMGGNRGRAFQANLSGAGDLDSRDHHPRGGDGPNGGRSTQLGPEPIQPESRESQSACCGRGLLRW